MIGYLNGCANMPEYLNIILLTSLAGLCIPIGGLIASIESIRPYWLEKELRHFLIAFGGGILFGAVTTVLVPEGMHNLPSQFIAIAILLLGALSFFFIERQLGIKRRESPQLMGMTLDFVPEAIALGGLVASGSSTALMLALLIGLQNLPEGFNAFRELKEQNKSTKTTLMIMFLLAPLGPLAGLFGYYVLAGHQAMLGAIMLFVSGGILYLIFQDIAPQSKLKKHWGPPLGAVFGYALVLFSNMLIGHR
ncbi:zinc transporter, ZIP family [Pseudoalteromonas phenolica O-BC30]|nr:zinc transporter, ZIP family [Pseudoalteromonas phenolica O-BC30]